MKLTLQKGKKMKTVKWMFAAAALVAVNTLTAETLPLNKAADWWTRNKSVTDGDGVIKVNGQTAMFGKLFTIDPNKSYTIKYEVSAPGNTDKKGSLVMGGFYVYDKDGKFLSCVHCCVRPQTFTSVTADAKKGSNVVMVKDASKFAVHPSIAMIADAKEDLSDLPNRNVVASGIKKVEKKGDVWQVTFSNKLLRDVKAGTAIRLHNHGGYIYTAGTKQVGKDWITMSGTIKGIKKGSWGPDTWPAGAAKAQFVICSDWNNLKNELQYKNITLTIE